MLRNVLHCIKCSFPIPFKQEAGVIDDVDIWCIIYRGYMYDGKTLYLCYRDMFKHWKEDNRLIG